MLGLIVVLKGQTTLPWWSYIIALLLGGELWSKASAYAVQLMCPCSVYHALLHTSLCTYGQWYRDEPADEDGCGGRQPREARRQPLRTSEAGDLP